MATSAAPQINAGSMADIAFLLLIFFLVTTTMDQDEGINTNLPPKIDGPSSSTHPRNVLEIQINSENNILLEKEPSDLSGIKEAVVQFYKNPENSKNLPNLTHISKSLCLEQIANAKDLKSKNKWEEKLQLVNRFGPYPMLPKKAVISIQNHSETSYSRYIDVYDAILFSVNELRDEICINAYGVHYKSLSKSNPEDRKKIVAIRALIPSRISEAEPYSSE